MAEGKRDFLRVLAAWLLPPLGVFMQVGIRGAFWINLLLTLCFWLPGILHAVWVITNTGEDGRPVEGGSKDFWRLVVAAILPPAGVFMQVGMGGAFWLNLLLCAFFWVPGMVHAAWVITTRD